MDQRRERCTPAPGEPACSLEPAASAVPSSARVGPYILLERLGAGGMGVVYRATDSKLGRQVAIKFLTSRLAQDSDQISRFRREAQMLAALNHPNIATLYGLEQAGETHYLAMEYVPGETLAELIDRGPTDLQLAARICCQVAEALETAHRVGMVHRDIKPANIKVTPEGRVKVLDFGLAKIPAGPVATAAAEDASTVTASLTVQGQIIGTPAYMSPEQVRGRPVDHRADIWAFGCVLYELLSSRRAFHSESVPDTLARILEREPDWKALPAATPAPVRDLLKSCLQKDPERRLSSIAPARAILASVKPPRWIFTRRRGLAIASSAVALAAGGSAFWLTARRSPAAASIVILPFLNVNGDPAAEYLCQGMSDSLSGALSRLPGLKVVARDSARRYQGQDRTPREIGRDLGVAKVLRGRLLQQGDKLSISVQLFDTNSGGELWSSQWDRSTRALLDVERDMTRQLLQKLAAGQPGPAPAPTGSSEAFRLYLQGRYYWSTRTEENLRKSAEAFQKAIETDPSYSLAWAGLADAYLMLGAWSVLQPGDAYPRARAAAMRATAMDPSLAEPHATLGYLKTLYEWDWSGADAEFQRAISLQDSYPTAHHWYAFYHQTMGDFDKSLAEIERARQLDPLSPVINSEISYFNAMARRHDRALAEARKLAVLEPSAAYLRLQLAEAYTALHKRGEAMAELDRILSSPAPDVVLLARSAAAYGVLGERAKALALLDQVLDYSRRRYVQPALLAIAYAAVDDKDRAFEYFDRSIDTRSLVASWLRAPELDKIRSDPRFKRLFARLGLKP